MQKQRYGDFNWKLNGFVVMPAVAVSGKFQRPLAQALGLQNIQHPRFELGIEVTFVHLATVYNSCIEECKTFPAQ